MRGLVLQTGVGRRAARQFRVSAVQRLFDETMAFWESWVGQSTYVGRRRDALHRSAITAIKIGTCATSLSP